MAATPLDTAVANIAIPTIDVSVLTSAPQAALMLQSLSILAACTIDTSLENEKTKGMISLLKTPRSFRASLYQTSASMSDAFRTADQAMLRIKINLDDLPQVMTSMVNAYAKPEDRGSKFIGNLRMKNFFEIAKVCTEEATRARQKFDDTLAVIQELIQVSTATVGDNEEKVQEAKKLLAGYEIEKAALEEQKQKLNEEIAQQKVRIQEASIKYDRASKKMTKTWNLIKAAAIDGFKSAFGFLTFGRAAGGASSAPPAGSNLPEPGPDAPSGGETSNNVTASESGRERINRLIDTASSVASKVSDTAIGSYQKAAELAKDMYIYQREMEQVLLKEDAANRMALAQIAAKLVNTNTEQLNLEEIIYYLSKGVKILGQIQQQWSFLQNFFASLESAVIGPLTRHLTDFDAIVKEEGLRESGILRNELAITGFKAAAVCSSVSRAATVYNKVSKKYVLPQIDSSVINMIMSRAEARAELPGMEARMQQVTQEVHAFIDQQLSEMQKVTADEMVKIRDDLIRAQNGTLYTPRFLIY